MKIQLYATESLSGFGSIIRKRDGFYDRITPYYIAHPNGSFPPIGYFTESPGIPCSQDWAKNLSDKFPMLYGDGSAHDYMFYGITKDIEVYKEEEEEEN